MMEENYLAKWVNGELSEDELEAFKKSEEYASYQKLKEVTDRLQEPNFSPEDALKRFINHTRAEPQLPKRSKVKPFAPFLRVAAVLAFLLVGSYFYLNSLDEITITQWGESAMIHLPDSSEVALNSGSELSYNPKTWEMNRMVSLEGEAFFRVAKGKKFSVSTPIGEVAVLGTQFNVQQREGFFEVHCYEGLVQVDYSNSSIELAAGSTFLVIDNTIIETATTTITQPTWLKNESSFSSIPLRYVLDELQRQHKIEVSAENVDLNQLFTGTFSNTDLNLALKSISTPLQLRYVWEGSKVLFHANDLP